MQGGIGKNSILLLFVYREKQLNVQSYAALGDLFFAALLPLFRIAVLCCEVHMHPGSQGGAKKSRSFLVITGCLV